MLPLHPSPTWVATLDRDDADALAAHWARLSPDCLRKRFLAPMTSEALAERAGYTFAAGAHVIGWFHGGVLRGVAELFPVGDGSAEASFTVEQSFRQKGIGQALLARVLRRARNLGLERVLILTMRDNMPMIRVARSAGAEFVCDGPEIVATCRLDRPDFASLAADAIEEGAGGLAAIADCAHRLAASWTRAALDRATPSAYNPPNTSGTASASGAGMAPAPPAGPPQTSRAHGARWKTSSSSCISSSRSA